MAKKTITLIANGLSAHMYPVEGDVLGLNYAFAINKLDRLSLIDEEKWFIAKNGESFYTLINELNIPILVQKHWKDLKNQIIYPLEEIIEKFGIEYFTCSQAYILALALYEGYEKIHLAGWDNHVSNTLDIEWNNIGWDEIICQNFWLGLLKVWE